jgi:hypothetical protein
MEMGAQEEQEQEEKGEEETVVVVVKEEEEEEEKLRYRRLPSVSLVSPWTRSWTRNSHRFTRRDKAGQRRHSFSKVLYTVFLILR